MTSPLPQDQLEDRRGRLLAGLAALVPEMQRRAPGLDRGAGFPETEIARLRDLGALAAPLPIPLGGLGMGTDPDGADALMEALRLIGRGNLSVGRLFEAHVNALRLVVRFASPAVAREAAGDAMEGRLFGLWVTDPPDAPLTLDNGVLAGAKAPCSGAGHANRALVTARLPSGETTMLLVALPAGEDRADLAGWDVHGMRAACSGRMTLDGLPPTALVGAPGDYLREPDFSAGAWRTSAVTLGGVEALAGELRAQLVRRGRAADPHQLTRVGEALIAQETAHLWVRRAARIGESDAGDPQDIANTVNLARIAVERAALDVIQLVQRGLGLAAFRQGSLAELLFRDLAMYLRQPAPDETLTVAAAHFMQRDLPGIGG